MSSAVPLSMGWFCPTLGDTTAFGDPASTIPQSMEHFERVAVAAEKAGFDYMLVPVTPICWDAWVTASFLVSRTTKLKALVAVKPGFIHPVAQAKMISTFDQLSQGRIYVNLIAGLSEKDAMAEGQLVSKEERYAQLEEEVVIIKKLLFNGAHFVVQFVTLARQRAITFQVFRGHLLARAAVRHDQRVDFLIERLVLQDDLSVILHLLQYIAVVVAHRLLQLSFRRGFRLVKADG